MTSGGNNFNDVSENELASFRAVYTVLRRINNKYGETPHQSFPLG